MEKEKINDDEKTDPENSLGFSEHFNQLELLETHGHLIPTGTQSLWVGSSDQDEEQDEKNEEWYQLQEKKMGKDPSKLLLWAAEKNRVRKRKEKEPLHKALGLEIEDLPL
jgi:hypothetical protein